ncbi:ribosomal RNA small subunit methyltransferase A [Candidatus Peribacteria bacterium RIFCSPLOWO2_12_FULL_55_15]|nr:MAG: ribosomal RNA small subunit methyltransferase A [Candidatus Peribacteria bacterium RIFCSPHIGHO2_01_FULL_54_22]OGJ63627.1 MAG: ribosomal RNA small subunit methyltransferase A [Candidatus Peribacteria bacterium RIFCSPHIGHO2_02_FULL_55_24]OGJ69077.1 MAG: ribosomal RNA small subunit methyltransferase A [Candidatus Peribacteria bacterium RIFCSPLOWO2_01_FULL_54_110]OGJ69956.1 MAG: ribosomal RNA small subunit methyltransferase A [Candidatus Peribacteria bacterium RIFCSPLOWO2_02_FULL_55_36]OGJ7
MSLAQEIGSFLRAHNIRLSREMGQHFLIDERVLRCIVNAANIQLCDHIVEIGAGIGVLTRELLKRTPHVTAIECDRRLIPLLQEFIHTQNQEVRSKNLAIVQENALKFSYPETPYKIVANIPYQITSNLFRTVFRKNKRPPLSLTLLIQKEVAEKIMGKPERSLLTLLVELYGTPRIIRTVSPNAFLPPPNVESAIIHIECFPHPLADEKTLSMLFELATIAFRKKRKMLRASLGKFTSISATLATASIDPTRRPETLTTDEWLSLAHS